MEILWMLIIGLAAGAVAKLLMPGDDPGGIIATMLLGIAGSFVGGFLAAAIGRGTGQAAGFVGAVIGAFVLLFLYRLVTKRGRRGPIAP